MANSLLGGGSQLTNVPASSLTGIVPLANLSGITSAQIDPATWQAVTNGASTAQVQAATNTIGAAFNLSVNTANLPHLQRAISAARPVRILWLGDSIGGNSTEAVVRLFEGFWANGVQRGSPFLGFPRYYSIQSGPWGLELGVGWWAFTITLTNTLTDYATQVWGGPSAGGYVPADTLSFWYWSDPSCGVARLEVSSDSDDWQQVADVDTSNGDGLVVTNFNLAQASYSVRVTPLNDRVRVLWASLTSSSQTNSLVGSACNSPGRDLGSFLAMGTNNIATLFTNLNPDLIFYEQKKDVWTRTNWPTLAGLIKTYTSADVCLLPGQISNGPNDYPVPDPTDSSYAVALVDRAIAISNGWTFVDDYTPLSDWPGIIVANGFNQDDVVHLNAAGQLFAGSVAVRTLRLLDLLYTSGRK